MQSAFLFQLKASSSSTKPSFSCLTCTILSIGTIAFFIPTMAPKKSKKNDSKAGKSQKSKRRNQNANNGAHATSKWSFQDVQRRIGTNVKLVYILGIVVVLAAIALNKIANQQNPMDDSKSKLEHLVELAYREGSCAEGVLHAENRKLSAGMALKRDTKLLEVPRSMQIWSLDAFRDNFIKNLAGARHLKTKTLLIEQAYLAAYLALRVKNNRANTQMTPIPLYLQSLPTYEDYKNKIYHPVTMDYEELNTLFGSESETYFLVTKKREEIESEYKAFVHKSVKFGETIEYDDYVAARLNVQTRAFEAGPLTKKDATGVELSQLKERFGVDIQTRFTAMVPLLDAFNSHNEQEQNIRYKYNSLSKKFLAFAKKDVARGMELFDTYGNRADHYPVYGFVNGDFSDRTSAKVGGHKIIDLRVDSGKAWESFQKTQILVYLQQDDGYKDCITNTDVVEMRFKRLKSKALLAITNRFSNWAVSFPPNPENEVPIPMDDGVNQIIATCRLVALSHHDYDGNAFNVLRDALDKLLEGNDESPLTLEKDSDALEYRSLVWVWRLASLGLQVFCGADSEEIQSCLEAERNNLESHEKHSKRWSAAYVRHQEITALHTLKQYAEYSYNEYARNDPDFNPEKGEYYIRSELCPHQQLDLF